MCVNIYLKRQTESGVFSLQYYDLSLSMPEALFGFHPTGQLYGVCAPGMVMSMCEANACSILP